MNFLKVEDELSYYNKMFMLKRDIEKFLSDEGYVNIEPSIFENYEEFTDANFRINKKTTVKVLNNNGEILILSPDITAGIVNKFIPKWYDGLKMKIFYYGKTYSHSTSGIEENRQMGIELIGEKTSSTDETVINTAFNILSKYSNNYLFEIGNSKFIKGLLQSYSFNKTEIEKVMNLLYKKNRQELEEFLNLYISKKPVNTLLNIFNLEGNFDEIIKSLNGLYINDLMEEGINELYKISQSLAKVKDKVIFDLSMVSKLNYYDGIIFKGYINGSNNEIIKGGRYDTFTEQYGRKIPAIGFSVELDELIKILCKEVM